MYNNSDKGLVIFFSVLVVGILSGFTYLVHKGKLKHPLYTLSLPIVVVGIIFCCLFILSLLLSSNLLVELVTIFAGVLLPLLWFLAALGFIVYGIIGIFRRETFVKIPYLAHLHGPPAIYFGLLIMIAGIGMMLMEAYVLGLWLCEENKLLCFVFPASDRSFGVPGSIQSVLMKPLYWLGYVSEYR